MLKPFFKVITLLGLASIISPVEIFSQDTIISHSMHFKQLTPNIIVEDVAANMEYYSKFLGFETITTVPDTGKPVFAMMKKDELTFMFQDKSIDSNPSFKSSVIGSTITLYIDITDIDSLFAKVKELNADIIQGIQSTFYNTREFVMRDCNGYVLIFAEGGN